jgi:ribosomal protein L7/L12
MGTITSQWIVERLITTPKNEFESGMNSAYISILKEIAPKSVPNQLSIDEVKLKTAVGDVTFRNLNQSEIDELLAYRSRNEKLGFVRRLKELTGCGLREGKDIADTLWQL